MTERFGFVNGGQATGVGGDSATVHGYMSPAGWDRYNETHAKIFDYFQRQAIQEGQALGLTGSELDQWASTRQAQLVSDWGRTLHEETFDNGSMNRDLLTKGAVLAAVALSGGALSGELGATEAGTAAAGGGSTVGAGSGAAAGGGETALGSGLTTGGTGLTAGSTGAGGITGSLAGTTYAGETLYPVIGGMTDAALAGGATTGGVLGTGLTAGQLGSLAGSLIPAGIGMYTANEAGNNMHDIYQTNRNDTMPYLTASQGWLANPSSYFTGKHSPGMTAINGSLRGLSVTGNPYGAPGKLEMAADAGMRSWLAATGQIGQLGLSGQNTNANLAVQGAQTDAQGWNSLGWGVGNYFNPQPNFNDFYKRYLQNGVT